LQQSTARILDGLYDMEIVILFVGMILFAGMIIQQGEPSQTGPAIRRRPTR
jgi:hypothetical protein